MNDVISRIFLAVFFVLGATGQERSIGSSQRKFRRNQLPAGVSRIIDFNCPEDFGYYPHPTECSQYYVCVFGGALLETCTGGLMYSNKLQTCDWPINAGCELGGKGISTVKITDPRTSPRTTPVSAATEGFPSSSSIRRGIDNSISTSTDDVRSRALRQGRFLPGRDVLGGQDIDTGFQAQETSSRTFNVVPASTSKSRRTFPSNIPSNSQRFSTGGQDNTRDKVDDYYYIYDDIIYDDYFDPIVEPKPPTRSRTPSRTSTRSQSQSQQKANPIQAPPSTSRRIPTTRTKSTVSTSFSGRPIPSSSSSSPTRSSSATHSRTRNSGRNTPKNTKKASARHPNTPLVEQPTYYETDPDAFPFLKRRLNSVELPLPPQTLPPPKLPSLTTKPSPSSSPKLINLATLPQSPSSKTQNDDVSHSSFPDPPPDKNKGPKLRIPTFILRSSPVLAGADNGNKRENDNKIINKENEDKKPQFPISTITVALLKNSQREQTDSKSSHREHDNSSTPKAFSAFTTTIPFILPFTRRIFSPPSHRSRGKNVVLKPEMVRLKSTVDAGEGEMLRPASPFSNPVTENHVRINEIPSSESDLKKPHSNLTTLTQEMPFMVISTKLSQSDLTSRLPASTSPIFTPVTLNKDLNSRQSKNEKFATIEANSQVMQSTKGRKIVQNTRPKFVQTPIRSFFTTSNSKTDERRKLSIPTSSTPKKSIPTLSTPKKSISTSLTPKKSIPTSSTSKKSISTSSTPKTPTPLSSTTKQTTNTPPTTTVGPSITKISSITITESPKSLTQEKDQNTGHVKNSEIRKGKPTFNIGLKRSKLSPLNKNKQHSNNNRSLKSKDKQKEIKIKAPKIGRFRNSPTLRRNFRPRFRIPIQKVDSSDIEILNNTDVNSLKTKANIKSIDTKTDTNELNFLNQSTPTSTTKPLPPQSTPLRSIPRSRPSILRPFVARISTHRKQQSNTQNSKLDAQLTDPTSTKLISHSDSSFVSAKDTSLLKPKLQPSLHTQKSKQKLPIASTTGKSISSGIKGENLKNTESHQNNKSHKKQISTITVAHLRNTHSDFPQQTTNHPNKTKSANQQPSLKLPTLNKSIDRSTISKTSSKPSSETGEESSSTKSKSKPPQGGSPKLVGTTPTRIKFPSFAQMPKPKIKEVTDIWKYPPRRPTPIRPQPPVGSAATTCDRTACQIPDCYCGGTPIPGGLSPETVPQMVLLTFDDSINDLNKKLYEELFERGRKNPNGCPIVSTMYVSHEWTDYSQVQNLYSDGHEIASHSITHSFGEQFSTKKWAQEIAGQREILSAYGGVRMEDVRGMRAPFLAIGGNRMFEMLYDLNFTYDSSMPVYNNNPPSWPYTLDYKLFHDCMIPPCPTKSYPGVWEVPMVMWQDLAGGRCSMADACSTPADANGVYDMLIKNFERHYTTNRSPFGLFYHAAWFTKKHHKEGFIAFLDAITALDDVWIVTNHQALQWVRDPVPLSQVKNFKPFGCDYPERPARCTRNKVCNIWHKGSARYMKTCQPCPSAYPWTGKTGVPSPLNNI